MRAAYLAQDRIDLNEATGDRSAARQHVQIRVAGKARNVLKEAKKVEKLKFRRVPWKANAGKRLKQDVKRTKKL